MVNRKLIRPNLAEIKERLSGPRPGAAAPAAAPVAAPAALPAARESDRHSGAPQSIHKRRPIPPEQTSAEAFYYLKQMNNRTPMVVVLDNGEELRGHIEWYDRSCIKVNRDGEPNLLIFKHSIKYLFKQEEENAGPTAVE